LFGISFGSISKISSMFISSFANKLIGLGSKPAPIGFNVGIYFCNNLLLFKDKLLPALVLFDLFSLFEFFFYHFSKTYGISKYFIIFFVIFH
jgi:hypothetical protein